MAKELMDGVIELSREEGVVLFDKACRNKLGISGEEFLRRYDAGEYDCGTGNCSPEAFKLAMLIPFARSEAGGE